MQSSRLPGTSSPAESLKDSSTETTMSDNKESVLVRIDLTPEQKEQVKAASEKSVDSIELTVQELEARITPRVWL